MYPTIRMGWYISIVFKQSLSLHIHTDNLHMSELQLQLSDVLLKLNSIDLVLITEGLQSVDALFGRLVLQASNDGINNSHQSGTSGSNDSGNNSNSNTNESRKKWRVPSNNDAVFGEFVTLQDSPAYNITSRLIRLLLLVSSTNSGDEYTEETILLLLKVLQGCLLLHPESRNLFQHEKNMSSLLNFISSIPPVYSSQVICSVVQTLVSCLVRNVPNLRLFERLNGPGIICNLLKYKPAASTESNRNDFDSSKEIQVKALEFLFFYLVPETHKNEKEQSQVSSKSSSRSSSPQPENLLHQIHSNDYEDGYVRRTTNDKATILRQFLNKTITENLVTELLENKPFGNMRNEW